MLNTNPPNQERIGTQLLEEISQIKRIALGEGAAECQACGAILRDGAPVVVLAVRPGDRRAFRLGHVKCTDCRYEPSEYFTLGVREVVLDGRVGRCTDQATQSSKPVLVEPRPRAVSPADTTDINPLPGMTWFRHSIAASDVFVAADCASTRKPWQRAVVRAGEAEQETDPVLTSSGDDTAESSALHTPDDAYGGVW